jgi:LmbE family N-acetylglucosaminyl deacetylase
MRVLHISPHPDDEMLGAPAALMHMQSQGAEIVNLACSLGRPEQTGRRAEEVGEACRRMGWELLFPEDMPSLRSGDITAETEEAAVAVLARYTKDFDVIVSPSPRDGHPAHELLGRAVGRTLPGHACWWQWGLWADLPHPTLFVPFGEEEMEKIIWGLRAHAGELQRNDYQKLLRARAEMNAVLGPERIWGWGVGGSDTPYAELISEWLWQENELVLAGPRELARETS